jgi:probable phosphoglycerate mutase
MRAVAALLERCAREAWTAPVVVSHGGVLDMIYRSATGQPLGGPRECLIPNAGLSHVRTDGQRFEIVAWGMTEHLQGLPPSAVYPLANPKA